MPCIAAERLAQTAIKTAFNGGDGLTIFENAQCLGDGKTLIFALLIKDRALTHVKTGQWLTPSRNTMPLQVA